MPLLNSYAFRAASQPSEPMRALRQRTIQCATGHGSRRRIALAVGSTFATEIRYDGVDAMPAGRIGDVLPDAIAVGDHPTGSTA
jgi:hypothetical protein